MIGVDGARYQSLEFCGDGVAELEMSDRFTICNMAIEAGGKNGIFPVDEKTIAYLNGRVSRQWTAVIQFRQRFDLIFSCHFTGNLLAIQDRNRRTRSCGLILFA